MISTSSALETAGRSLELARTAFFAVLPHGGQNTARRNALDSARDATATARQRAAAAAAFDRPVAAVTR